MRSDLRKALGATPRVIRRQFLVEASVLGPGRVASRRGLGLLGAWILPHFISDPITISPVATAGAIAVAVGIGVAFGVYPASRAAKLPPSMPSAANEAGPHVRHVTHSTTIKQGRPMTTQPRPQTISSGGGPPASVPPRSGRRVGPGPPSAWPRSPWPPADVILRLDHPYHATPSSGLRPIRRRWTARAPAPVPGRLGFDRGHQRDVPRGPEPHAPARPRSPTRRPPPSTRPWRPPPPM